MLPYWRAITSCLVCCQDCTRPFGFDRWGLAWVKPGNLMLAAWSRLIFDTFWLELSSHWEGEWFWRQIQVVGVCVCGGETFSACECVFTYSPLWAVHLRFPLPRSGAESDSCWQTVMDVSGGPSDGVSIEAINLDLSSTSFAPSFFFSTDSFFFLFFLGVDVSKVWKCSQSQKKSQGAMLVFPYLCSSWLFSPLPFSSLVDLPVVLRRLHSLALTKPPSWQSPWGFGNREVSLPSKLWHHLWHQHAEQTASYRVTHTYTHLEYIYAHTDLHTSCSGYEAALGTWLAQHGRSSLQFQDWMNSSLQMKMDREGQ